MKTKEGIRRTAYGQERALLALSLVGLAEDLLCLLTLGRYTADWRMTYLLSDHCDRLEQEGRRKWAK